MEVDELPSISAAEQFDESDMLHDVDWLGSIILSMHRIDESKPSAIAGKHNLLMFSHPVPLYRFFPSLKSLLTPTSKTNFTFKLPTFFAI